MEHARELAQFMIDLAPGFGSLEALAQLSTGRSSITGEEVSRLWASLGLIPVAGTLKRVGEPAVDGLQAIAKGLPDNVAAHAAYKDSLRAAMEKPIVADGRLADLIDDLYQPNATIGSGSTAAAVRHEIATGEPVKGKMHTQKSY